MKNFVANVKQIAKDRKAEIYNDAFKAIVGLLKDKILAEANKGLLCGDLVIGSKDRYRIFQESYREDLPDGMVKELQEHFSEFNLEIINNCFGTSIAFKLEEGE